MSRISLGQLKDRTGVTDDQLAVMCIDAHLNELADHIGDYGKFAQMLQLKGWRITEINTDLGMNYVMKTRAVLKQWKTDNVFGATYGKLLSVVLSLSEGVLAIKICELCKRELKCVASCFVCNVLCAMMCATCIGEGYLC